MSMSKLGDTSLACVLAGFVLLFVSVILARMDVPLPARAACALLAVASAAVGLVAGVGGRTAKTGQLGILLGTPVLFFAAALTALSCLLLTQ